MPSSSVEPFEAVFLFQDSRVARELLYHEFEAILDGYIPVPEFAGTLAKAAFATINHDHSLTITGMVFFLVGFDAEGIVDRRWNVPLRQLADTGGVGPDLGSGSIRLTCYSQCHVPAQQKNLWDPLMQQGNNSFIAIYKAVRNNSLGLVATHSEEKQKVKEAEVSEKAARDQIAAIEKKLHDQYSKVLLSKMERIANEQRLHTETLVGQYKSKDQVTQLELHRRLLAYEQKQARIDKEKCELEEANRKLKENLDAQTNKVEGMREYISHRLKSVQEDEDSHLETLRANFAVELDTKIRTATAELREMLEMRDVELFYRHQTESVLKEEIASLKRENQEYLSKSAQFMLDRFAKANVSLTTNLPGLGDVVISRDDIARYLEDPQSYTAERAGVSYPIYMAWTEHQQTPCCSSVEPSGRACGRSVPLVATPSEFRPGESDRCDQHQTATLSLVVTRR